MPFAPHRVRIAAEITTWTSGNDRKTIAITLHSPLPSEGCQARAGGLGTPLAWEPRSAHHIPAIVLLSPAAARCLPGQLCSQPSPAQRNPDLSRG